MPATKTITPLHVKLKPSLWLQRFNTAIHLLACLAVAITPIVWLVKLVLALGILFDFLFYRRRFSEERRELIYDDKSGWQLAGRGEIHNVDIQSSTVLSIWCVFLHLQNSPPMLVTRDSLDDEDYRRLLVKLKLTRNTLE